MDFEDFDDGYGAAAGQGEARRARLSRLVNLAGAVSSIALVVGLGVWGYKLAVRDVTGIPVIRAMEGPMRVAPENPGGEVAAHQGLAVNDVAAVGTAAPPPETLILAPRPVELSQEDGASEQLNGAAPAAALDGAELAPVLAPVAPLVPTEPQGADPDAVAAALAEALATDPDTAVLEEATDEALLTEEVAALPVEGAAPVAATIRPRPRPAAALTTALAPAGEGLGETAPALAGTVAPATTTTEVDAAMIPSGTRLVQLGAFDTEEQARSEWVKLSNQFGPAFAGKALVVQAAESGGRTFFRLRAHGFADETEARGFCLTLLDQNASCIPVEQR